MTNITDYSHYKVLIIDDHLLSLKLMEKQMEILGFTHFDVANDPIEAFHKLEEQQYDIVMLDWMMPALDGVSLVKQARALQNTSHTAFVMFSAQAETECIEEALKAGVTAYIKKPVTHKDLKEKIEVAIEWLNTQ